MIREKSKKNLQEYIIHFQQLPSQGQSCFIHTHTSPWMILKHNHFSFIHKYFRLFLKYRTQKISITQYQN